MNIDYRPFLLVFAIAYGGIAVGSLLIAMNLAQSAPLGCFVSQCADR